jgi:hypothetical protein
MEAEEFGLGDIDEMFAIFGGDKFSRNCHEMRARLLAVHRCAHDIAQWLAIAKAEGIGFAQGLAHSRVALGGAFIGPDEYVPEQADVAPLVHGEHRAGVKIAGHIGERQGRQQRR